MEQSCDGEKIPTFAELGLLPALCEACERVGYTLPTPIQAKAIPLGLQHKDVIGLAQTGSGKTAAFALPILNHLLSEQQPFFACVLAPTRELAIQIGETFDALGVDIGLKTAILVGGVDSVAQAIAISKKPHVLIATPGRLIDHLENTKGFNLKNLRFLILDEADRLLDMDFGVEIDKILKAIPRERTTFLFSATMTSKVAKLQRASLQNPAKVEVSTKYQTVESLVQSYLFVPAKYKECYLVHLLSELTGSTMIVFVSTCNTVQKLTLILRNLGIESAPIHGQLNQHERLNSLNKFKTASRSVLIATDVASRGLDIPSVDVVINFDVPSNSKDYIHRVGRTARAGRSGKSITIVSQYDVEQYQKIEESIGKKLDEYALDKDLGLTYYERVCEAQRLAVMELKENASNASGPNSGMKKKRSAIYKNGNKSKKSK